MLKKFKTSQRAHFLTLGVMFLIMLIFNVLTKRIADDFMYSLSFATGKHLDGLQDIMNSLVVHGQGVNGRYFAHFFAHLFLSLPDIVFDLVNAAVFVSTVYIVYRVCNAKNTTNNLFLVAIFGAVWLFEHEFGQINIWLDGSCNYLFGVLFGLLYILPYINSLLYQKSLPLLLILPHMLVSVLLGGYLEPLTVGFGCMAGLFTLTDLFYYKNKQALRLIPSLLSSAFGLYIMVSAPAERVNKLSEFSFSNLFETVGVSLFVLASIFPVAWLYIALFKRAKRENTDNRVLITSGILAIGALISNFILLIAKHYPLRCSVAFVFLAIFATALLYGNVKDFSFGPKAQKVCKLFSVALVLALVIGLADNVNTFVALQKNERIIAQSLERGEKDVELYLPVTFTKYNGLNGLIYLDTESAQNWPNFYFADYYGLDTVIGKNKMEELFGFSW